MVLLGGFTTNLLWCVSLNIRNKSGGEYVGKSSVNSSELFPQSAVETSTTEAVAWDPRSGTVTQSGAAATATVGAPAGRTFSVPLIANYAFAGRAGIIWYLQFFFYTMGQAKLGASFAFSNWTLHMASIMIFSMLWGVALKEWTGASKRTHGLIALGLALLVGSTVVIGYANYSGGPSAG